MMNKFLFLIALVVGLYLWLTRSRTRIAKAEQNPAKPSAAEAEPMPMVRCAQCGVHLPAAEAIAADSLQFCSEAHRRLGKSAE